MNIATEFLCLVVALRYQAWLGNSSWRLFIPFLSFTLFIEILASFVWPKDNGWLYNIYVQVQFAFFSYFFYEANEAASYRKILLVLTVLFYTGSIFDFLFRTSFHYFNLLVFTIDAFLTTLYAIFFLLYCIEVNDIRKIAKQSPALWVTTGVVVFFSVSPVVFNAYEFIRSHKLKIAGDYIDNIVPQFLSFVMYGCFAFAFSQWKKIKSSIH